MLLAKLSDGGPMPLAGDKGPDSLIWNAIDTPPRDADGVRSTDPGTRAPWRRPTAEYPESLGLGPRRRRFVS